MRESNCSDQAKNVNSSEIKVLEIDNICLICKFNLSESENVLKWKQTESETFLNIIIVERNKTKTYSQHFYFERYSFDTLRHLSHKISIKLDADNQSIF